MIGINPHNYNGEYITIKNTRIYGLEESKIASGYPMSTEVPKGKAYNELVSDAMYDASSPINERSQKLGAAKTGSGHDCFLKGVVVQMDVTFPQYVWQQAKRYHWFDFVSSQSTMHRITKMDIEASCNKFVHPAVINVVKGYIDCFNNADNAEDRAMWFQYIVSNIPSGFMLTARITTNYLQLKTMYNQRKGHKLSEWGEFCDWCSELPEFLDLTQRVA